MSRRPASNGGSRSRRALPPVPERRGRGDLNVTTSSSNLRGSTPMIRLRKAKTVTSCLGAALTAGALAAMMLAASAWPQAQQRAASVAIDADDIGGVVTGPKGPEAGVWVVGE